MAGYPFFIIKDRQGNLQAFHNVCRHRAFPVITKPEGNASILACGYHGESNVAPGIPDHNFLIPMDRSGWSYGFNGKLAKAPLFQNEEGFKPKDHNQFSIHLHVDRCGFVWVNFEATKKSSILWEEQCAGADTQERLKESDMEQYVYDHSWKMDGMFNWKNLMDNYNEICLNIQIGPDNQNHD